MNNDIKLSLPEGLKHIAVIMDGNGRWARQKGKERVFGHRQGAESVKELVKLCSGMGLGALSLFAFSTENWDRPADEVKALMNYFEDFLKKERKTIMDRNIRFIVTGQLHRLPKNVTELAGSLMKDSASNGGMVLNLAVSYGGRQDILEAVKKIAEAVQKGTLPLDKLDENGFSEYLWTKGLPDPDLLIRTSGEMRISNFMIWQMAYTEIYVTETLWPDFGREELEKALESFSKRKRRYGRVGD